MSSVQQPIGIFGGTFDPVHFGHLRPALELREQLSMQQMLMLPCSIPPHRDTPQVTTEHRLAMLQLAVADEPLLQVDQRELQREGPSYMVDTLQEFREEYGEAPLCLCLGLDAFLGLPRWHRWEDLLQLAHIAVAHRPGWKLEMTELAPELQQVLQTSLSDKVAALTARPAGTVMLHAVTQLAISATGIREAITAGHSARYLMPDPVWDYIQEKRLYSS